MKVALLGATGRVGSNLLEKLLEDQYKVKILVRDAAKIGQDSTNLSVIEGNALDIGDILHLIRNTDIVISAIGTDGQSTVSDSIKNIVPVMNECNVDTIITIGTAGILQSRSEPYLYRFQSSESKRKLTRAAEDHLEAYKVLAESELKWTIVCPTYLPDGEETGIFRVEKDFLPEGAEKITVGDTALFAHSLLTKNEFVRSRVGISY
jgi:uncharacterized protein